METRKLGRPFGTKKHKMEFTQHYDIVFISKFDNENAVLDMLESIDMKYNRKQYSFDRSEPISFLKYNYKIFATLKITSRNYENIKVLKKNSEYGVYDFIILSFEKKYKTKYDKEC